MGDLNSSNSTPSTSRISVEPSLSGEYEVFLSFHGKDTRKGFTDVLYTQLDSAGVRTYRDDKELRVGEEIGPELTTAIENSKICIPIFSKNYASSKWCLLELAHVVKCHAEANGEKMIFPIFYDVEPHDVRHQSGSYEEAFQQHEKNKSLEVQIWKDALAKVGGLKGFELEKETSGRQGELAKLTVEKCLHFLKKHHQHVSSNMVGMENHIIELKSLLQVDSNEVRIVGIHGMGGLGKTTMAKIIYNELCQHFEAHCFLENIRENSCPRRNIVNLQSQLISKIQKRRAELFNDVNEGCRRINEVVRGRKLLIVLDDADEKFQVDKLMGNGSWFSPRSRIIITTRNKSVLNSIKRDRQTENLPYVYASYEPEFMDELHSLQLFSKYAFRRDTPLEEYSSLSKEVVSIAAGLPLVLVVLGSTFWEVEDIDLWEENVRKLRVIPNGEVLETLKFSFDALTHEQKEIFLDIACLFIGENEQICRYMWDDCKYFPKGGIDVLINRSLITIGSENEFKMHDQLRDLGRHIVDKESLKELGKRSRLWREEEAMDVLETNQGTSFINALRLPKYYEGNMWQRIMPLLGSSFPDKQISGSRFQDVANLRYLSLGFRDIDGDFTGRFSKLRWLQWKSVRTFKPKNLHMENLVVLDLSHSSFTDYWEGWNLIDFGKRLKHLDLSYCNGARVLRHFSMCTSLEYLNLRKSSVCRLDGLEVFKRLKYLNASNCRKLETLSGLEKLESLQDLSIEKCRSLRRLPDLSNLKMLKYLNASRCYSLETLSDLSNITKLVKLNLKDCRELHEIRGLEKLESLHDLSIEWCRSLTRLPDLSNLKMLKRFNSSSCDKLVEVVGLEKLESLETLNFAQCESLERLPNFSKLKNLKRFEARGCDKLIMVEGMHKLNALEHLDLGECMSFNYALDISNLHNLIYLGVSGPELQVKDTCFKKLKHLKIYTCDEIQLPCGWESLESLVISCCKKLIKIEGLDRFQSLISLIVEYCPCFESLSDLPNFGTLKKIHVIYCERLQDVAALGAVESLEELYISNCAVLREIPNLRSWKSLKELKINDLPQMAEVNGLEELKSLESLEIKGCCSMNISNIKEYKKIS